MGSSSFNFKMVLVLGLMCVIIGCAYAQSASNAKARYHYFNSEANHYSLDDSKAYCAPWYDNQSLEWKKKYPWTAYCGVAPTGKAACGKCLKVTNAKTGAAAVVRIVDQCRSAIGSLSLDVSVFRDLDTDNTGLHQGYLTVNYEFVSC